MFSLLVCYRLEIILDIFCGVKRRVALFGKLLFLSVILYFSQYSRFTLVVMRL